MKSNLPYLVILILFFSACGEKTDQVKTIKKEVMDVHDEVMPKMGDLRKVSRSLFKKSEATDSSAAVELNKLAEKVEAANESMMEWMNQYEPQFDGSEQEQIKYYTDQKTTIQEVRDQMLNALEEGQKALAE